MTAHELERLLWILAIVFPFVGFVTTDPLWWILFGLDVAAIIVLAYASEKWARRRGSGTAS